jgi:peptidoglycan/xylan/chitin deacetylase (PgdA/CDA1 family)
MQHFKGNVYQLSSMLSLPKLFNEEPSKGHTTILHHSFIAPNETKIQGRDRLKYQLEWAKENYAIKSSRDVGTALLNGEAMKSTLVFTADDALTDLLDVYDIFDDFNIPLTVFICSGWVDNNEVMTKATLGRVADFIRWYKGDDLRINLGKYGEIFLSQNLLDETLDWVVLKEKAFGADFVNYAWEALIKYKVRAGSRKICTWRELKDLYNSGVIMGAHSVTHCQLASKSQTRIDFEVNESKRVIQSYFSSCDAFAYPFGKPEVINDITTSSIQLAGYDCAFLTHPGFNCAKSNIFRLPRMVMPDHTVSINEYKARVKGGTIPFDIIKDKLNTSR